MDIMTSMRLTIIVLIVLASASIFSIIFLQMNPTDFYNWQEYYASHMNPVKFKLFMFFQLFTPYHSWWFIGLLSMLSVSLLLCSINRLKGMIKLVFGRSDFRSNEKLSKQKNFHSFKLDPEASEQIASNVLKKRFYRVFSRKEDGKTYIYARKHSLSRMGPFLSHVGLLALFVGGLIAAIAGKTAMIWGGPGDVISAPFAEQKIRVDDFHILYNEEGDVKDYISKLTVLDDSGNSILSETIEVNHPLRYAGVSYYQASYQPHPRKVRRAMIAVEGDGGVPRDTLVVHFGERVAVPGTDFEIELADFAADFQITENGPVSKSRQLRNPALLLNYYDNDESIGHEWLFAKFPSVHTNKDLPFQSKLLDFEPLFYTGLQAAYNPGSTFIWAGFLIMTLGLILVFYLNHKQIWITFVHKPGSKDEVYLAGTSHKFKDQFRREVKEIVRNIKDSRDVSMEKSQAAPEAAVIN